MKLFNCLIPFTVAEYSVTVGFKATVKTVLDTGTLKDIKRSRNNEMMAVDGTNSLPNHYSIPQKKFNTIWN